jgi:hypothetical protein
MKRLLTFITLLLLYTTTSFGTCKISNNTDAKNTPLFERVFALVSKDLDIDTCNLEITISYSIFKEPVKAATIRSAENSYVINISEYILEWDKPEIFIHELVHISQIEHHKLVIYRYSAWFEGKTYTNDIPYEERRYENEAMKGSRELTKKYCKELK